MFYKSLIWIDFTLIGFVFIFFIRGLLRGFNKEVFSLLFWILASWVGLTFNHEFSVFLGTVISHPIARIGTSFIALFIITLSVGSLISLLVSLLTKNTKLTFMGRLGGMVLGGVRGAILVTVVVILAGLTPLPKDSWWTESTVLPPFQILAVWLRDHISSDMAKYINYR
jgi:membrane protein required for colicin V production